MIHEIEPLVFDNSFAPRKPRSEDIALSFSEDLVLLKNQDGVLALPTIGDLLGLGRFEVSCAEYLFSIDEKGFYLAEDSDEPPAPGYELHSTQIFRQMSPRHMAFAGITGSQIYRWKRNNRFCGKCGGAMRACEDERALLCTDCSNRVYPKISPAVIVAVTDGDRLLMARSANGHYRRFALIAGFVEIGETFERAVKREVMEEVGLKVKDVRYYKSQPWAFTDTEMIGFFATLDGDPTIRLQESELAEARWFARHEIPEQPFYLSVGSEMIRLFKRSQQPN